MKEQVVNPWAIGWQWFLRKARQFWFEGTVLVILFYMFEVRKLDVRLEISGQAPKAISQSNGAFSKPETEELSLVPKLSPGQAATEAARPQWKPADFDNLIFILQPELAHQLGVPTTIVEQKFNICLDYVQQYLRKAKQTARTHHIPVSIILAQALLESNAGMSHLATHSNNHFGIKCSRKCRGCTCRNYADDDQYDMFRVFESAEESFDAHARLLSTRRYAPLKKFGRDYRKWAVGLKNAGYATDRRYAEKLIRIIETLKLYRYDGEA